MGRRKQPQPSQAVTPVEPVTPVQTINPEGHTGNAWVPIGSQSTQDPGQPTQAPGQTGSQISGTGRFGAAGRTAQQARNYEFWKKRRNFAGKSRGGSMGAPVTPGAAPQIGTAPGQPGGGGVTQLGPPTHGGLRPMKRQEPTQSVFKSGGWSLGGPSQGPLGG